MRRANFRPSTTPATADLIKHTGSQGRHWNMRPVAGNALDEEELSRPSCADGVYLEDIPQTVKDKS